MNKEHIFSIIVPVYNVKDYIEDCINSILVQTFQEFEVIIVDDGSTDGSDKICDSFQSQRVKVIHQENQGHTNARKCGVMHSHGDYIVFVDSDDTIEVDFLERVYQIITTHEVDLVQCHIRRLDKAGKILDESNNLFIDGFYNNNDITNYILPKLMMDKHGCFFPRSMCSKVMRRSIVLKAITMVPSIIKTGEDMCCVIAMFKDIKSLYIKNDIYYNYRFVENSVSRSSDSMALKRCIYTLNYLKELTTMNYPVLWRQYARLAIQQVYSACVRALRDGNICLVKNDFQTLKKETIFNELLSMANFSCHSLKMKKILLKIEWFRMIRFLDRRM